MHTELSMQPGEFEQFNIVEEASITFCLKELRSLLVFAEYLQLRQLQPRRAAHGADRVTGDVRQLHLRAGHTG